MIKRKKEKKGKEKVKKKKRKSKKTNQYLNARNKVICLSAIRQFPSCPAVPSQCPVEAFGTKSRPSPRIVDDDDDGAYAILHRIHPSCDGRARRTAFCTRRMISLPLFPALFCLSRARRRMGAKPGKARNTFALCWKRQQDQQQEPYSP